MTRATERNGRANAKNPTEPVSLMELRVTKCLKYHRLEQEGPVCKDGRFAGVSHDISRLQLLKGMKIRNVLEAAGWLLGPGPSRS